MSDFILAHHPEDIGLNGVPINQIEHTDDVMTVSSIWPIQYRCRGTLCEINLLNLGHAWARKKRISSVNDLRVVLSRLHYIPEAKQLKLVLQYAAELEIHLEQFNAVVGFSLHRLHGTVAKHGPIRQTSGPALLKTLKNGDLYVACLIPLPSPFFSLYQAPLRGKLSSSSIKPLHLSGPVKQPVKIASSIKEISRRPLSVLFPTYCGDFDQVPALSALSLQVVSHAVSG
ncbi:hypothetical protein B0H14DRAFT_3631913 [Mycena olivaceomarginata]|nr:hypothetical protein B0H14DRAFT_3631913 [Mycena olivaceomarginata]